MKICVDVQGKDNVHVPVIRIPNALLRSKKVIRQLLDQAGVDMDEKTIEKITEYISKYSHLYKGKQLVEVEVFSKDGSYVHVEITL